MVCNPLKCKIQMIIINGNGITMNGKKDGVSVLIVELLEPFFN